MSAMAPIPADFAAAAAARATNPQQQPTAAATRADNQVDSAGGDVDAATVGRRGSVGADPSDERTSGSGPGKAPGMPGRILAGGSQATADGEKKMGDRKDRIKRLRDKRKARKEKMVAGYKDSMAELFLLQSNGCVTDLQAFKRKPTGQFLNFLQSNRCPSDIFAEVRELVPASSIAAATSNTPTPLTNVSTTPRTPSQSPAFTFGQPQRMMSASSQPSSSSTPRRLPIQLPQQISYTPRANALSPVKLGDKLQPYRQSPLPGFGTSSPSPYAFSRQQFSENVKQEAWVLKRIQELTREGLWSPKRFPKVCERPRMKSQQEFMLQEMQWLSVDFYQERQWKKAAARMLAYSAKEFVEKWEEKKAKERARREKKSRLVASFVAKEVRGFWDKATQLSEAQIKLRDQLGDDADSFVALFENGLEDLASDYEDESTISEQERFEEEEHAEKGGDDPDVEELKDLAFEMTQPLKAVLPDDYPNRLCSPKNDKDECNEELDEDDDDDTSSTEDIRDLDDVSLERLVSRNMEEKTLRVPMSSRQRQLYDDYLAKSTTQECIQQGDLDNISKVINNLRRICNHPRLTSDAENILDDERPQLRLPRVADDLSYSTKFCTITSYDPHKHIDLASLNMVFLAHESRLTALTSNRIGKVCAPKKLIEELPNKKDSPAPKVPAQRFAMEFTRTTTQITSTGRAIAESHVVKKEAEEDEEEKMEVEDCSEPEKLGAFHKESLGVIATYNRRRCKGMPLYGQDCINALTVVYSVKPTRTRFRGMSYVNCLNARLNEASAISSSFKKSKDSTTFSDYNNRTDSLARLVSTGQNCIDSRGASLALTQKPFTLVQSRSATPHLTTLENRAVTLLKELSQEYNVSFETQEEPSLIEASPCPSVESVAAEKDSSKLQKLLRLLVKVRQQKRQAVVFCEMADMLHLLRKVFQSLKFPFIFYDGNAQESKRLEQFARFAKSSEVVFLLANPTFEPCDDVASLMTSRVNHVIFYDSPASDFSPLSCNSWCRLLAISTRDNLRLIRLVCESSVEDSISRKSMQEKLMTDLRCADEDKEGQVRENGVMWKLRKQTIEDLFGIGVSGDNGIKNDDDDEKSLNQIHADPANRGTLAQINLLWSKDDSGEEAPSSSTSSNSLAGKILLESTDPYFSGAFLDAEETARILDKLTPLQKYALRKSDDVPSSPVDVLSQNDLLDLEEEKLHWESNFQAALTDLAAEIDYLDSMPNMTYSSEDAGRFWHGRDGQPMPLWSPSASPMIESEVVDHYLSFLYKTDLMEESELPTVHVKKEPGGLNFTMTPGGQQILPTVGGIKRTASEAGINFMDHMPNTPQIVTPGGTVAPPGLMAMYDNKPPKIKREDNSATVAPRSLFDRAITANSKMRKGPKAIIAGGAIGPATLRPGQVNPITMNPAVANLRHPLPRPQVDAENAPEWLIQEDWALLYAVRELQQQPLGLQTNAPAHLPNWDMVADIVNSVSRTYRPPRLCRQRFETIIVPREEGRILYDVTAAQPPTTPNSKNKKKNTKSGMKNQVPPKINKAMKTSQLFSMDNNVTWSKLYANRFETIKAVANKRTPTTKPLLVNPTQKNSKHAAVLAESGINYESPLNPIRVAANRADRIQKEKQRNHQQDQQQLQQRVAAQNAATIAQQAAAVQQRLAVPAGTAAAGVATSHVIQQQPNQQPTVVAVSSANNPAQAQAVVVGISQASGAAGGGTPQQVIVQGSPQTLSRLAVQQQQQGQNQSPNVVNAVQEIASRVTGNVAAAAAAHQSTIVVSSQSSVVSVANLPTQLANARIVGQPGMQRNVVATAAQGKTLTPQQIQMLRQQQQQQLKAKQGQLQAGTTVVGGTTNTGQKVSVAVTPSGSLATVAAGSNPGVSGTSAAGNLNAVTVVTQALAGQPKAHLIQQLRGGGAKNIRAVSEKDMTLLLRQQQQLAGNQKALVQVPGGQANLTQLLQAGIQIQPSSLASGGAPVVTLVKTASGGQPGQPGQVTIPVANVNLPTVKAAIRGNPVASPQMQLIPRQLLQQRPKGGTATLAAAAAGQQKVQFSQVGGKGVPAQLIVSSGQKQIPQQVTVQQIQQIVKSVQGPNANLQQLGTPSNIIPHGATGSPQQVQARVIPVTSAPGGRQQQIQVVTASPNPNNVVAAIAGGARQVVTSRTGATSTSAAPNVTIDASGLPTTSKVQSQLANALASGPHIKVTAGTQQQQQQQLYGGQLQQGQPVSVAVRSGAQGQKVQVVTSSQVLQQQKLEQQQQK